MYALLSQVVMMMMDVMMESPTKMLSLASQKMKTITKFVQYVRATQKERQPQLLQLQLWHQRDNLLWVMLFLVISSNM